MPGASRSLTGVKKPTPRPKIPPRRSDNDKRRLVALSAAELERLQKEARYAGSSKHKKHPHLYGLDPYRGPRGDETYCDTHANFQPADMALIPTLIQRGLQAGLVGTGAMLWTVADNGWIFEARLTNARQSEYHGYPVRSSEPIARIVYERFTAWVTANGTSTDRLAQSNCKLLYKFE